MKKMGKKMGGGGRRSTKGPREKPRKATRGKGSAGVYKYAK